jgi:hypothetical protein
MNNADDTELHRLCSELEQINQRPDITTSQCEALKKAAIALSMAFGRNLRRLVEDHYNALGQPLSDEERQRMLSLGINPDAD